MKHRSKFLAAATLVAMLLVELTGAALALDPLTPTVVTQIHLDNETVVNGSVAVGSIVHDMATVTGSGPTPTGSVQFYFFVGNDTCTANDPNAGLVDLDGAGVAHPSKSEGPLAAGLYSFRAQYLGDSNYAPAWSACEPLTVGRQPPTVVTEIHLDDETVVNGPVPVGSIVHDKATVTGSGPTPTGYVQFYFFVGNDTCTANDPNAGLVALDGAGVAHPSKSEGPLAAGLYSFQAYYLGDSNYDPAWSACEPLTVAGTTTAPLTPGYWKNHLAPTATLGCLNLPSGTGCSNNGPWTNDYLPQWLGAYSVDTIRKAAKVFAGMNCSNTGTVAQKTQNAIGCLAGHLLAAELNVANGADTCILPVINKSNTFLTNPPQTWVTFLGNGANSIDYTGPTGDYTGIGAARRSLAIALKSALGNYNNGFGCP